MQESQSHIRVGHQDFFGIRLATIVTDIPLPFDIFLVVNEKPTLFRKQGDIITAERLTQLLRHGGTEFLVPKEQRTLFLSSLKHVVRNPDLDTSTKSRVLKETAFIHVEDLFTKKEVKPVVEEAGNLVKEMVHLVSSDVAAAASLMHLSVHDYYTYNHCVDVAVYSIALAKRIYGDDEKMLFMAGMGGLLHDIGKRRIDWSIINKKVPLTKDEWEEIKKHPDYGIDLIRKLDTIPEDSKSVVHQHHENFDGTGYPRKLKGDEISKLARIVSIADVFDALTTNRSYHEAIPPAEALKTMYSMQPGKFDPSIFRSFDKNFMQRKSPIELPEDFDPCQGGHQTIQSQWWKKDVDKKKTG